MKLIKVFMNTEWPGYTKVFLVNLAIVAVGCSCAMFYDKVRIWNLSIVNKTVKIGDIIRYAGSFCAMIYMFFLPCGVKVSCKKIVFLLKWFLDVITKGRKWWQLE